MKRFSGPTDNWRFPITGEETWAGVNVRHAFAFANGTIQHHRRFHYVTPTQQFTQFSQIQS
jgi:hypothetical protein